MIQIYTVDGNTRPLDDAEGLIAAIEQARPEDWAGETGQMGIERPDQQSWLFLSLACNGSYYVYSQRSDGRKIYAHDPGNAATEPLSLLIAGRDIELEPRYGMAADDAAQIARYFIEQDGLLLPTIHWEHDGKSYQPQF